MMNKYENIWEIREKFTRTSFWVNTSILIITFALIIKGDILFIDSDFGDKILLGICWVHTLSIIGIISNLIGDDILYKLYRNRYRKSISKNRLYKIEEKTYNRLKILDKFSSFTAKLNLVISLILLYVWIWLKN